LHRDFPEVSQATICSYFGAGIAVGVLQFQVSKDWAFTVIEASDSPPIEIIDIAAAGDRNSAMDALQSAAHGADHQTAGRWLLADISQQLLAGDMTIADATRAAMRVAQTTSLADKVYYEFDGLDDELQLVLDGAYGTLDSVKTDLLVALGKHSGAT
jgi:hypothetical protein